MIAMKQNQKCECSFAKMCKLDGALVYGFKELISLRSSG